MGFNLSDRHVSDRNDKLAIKEVFSQVEFIFIY